MTAALSQINIYYFIPYSYTINIKKTALLDKINITYKSKKKTFQNTMGPET